MNENCVLVVDDHKVVRDGIKFILDSIKEKFNITLINETDNGGNALELVKEYCYDVIFLDINMPDYDGLDLIGKFKEIDKNIKVIIMSMYDDNYHYSTAKKNGADAYLLKNSTAQDISEAIENVLNEEKYFEGYEKMKSSKMVVHLNEIDSVIEKYDLSNREVEVLVMLSKLSPDDVIMQKLDFGKRTLEHHKYQLRKKLNLSTTNEVIRFSQNIKFV